SSTFVRTSAYLLSSQGPADESTGDLTESAHGRAHVLVVDDDVVRKADLFQRPYGDLRTAHAVATAEPLHEVPKRIDRALRRQPVADHDQQLGATHRSHGDASCVLEPGRVVVAPFGSQRAHRTALGVTRIEDLRIREAEEAGVDACKSSRG